MSNSEGRDPKPKFLPGWFSGAVLIILVLFIGFNVAYRMGATGMKVSGARTSFNREHDKKMFKIDDTRAFLIQRDFVAVVKYTGGTPPFRPLCGMVKTDGSIFNMASFRKGDWLYSRYPEFDGPDAYNLATGELVRLDVKRPEGSEGVNPADVPFYVEHGFTFDPSLELSPERVAKEYEELSAINESCVTFNAAFVLLFGFLALMSVPLIVVGLKRRRAG